MRKAIWYGATVLAVVCLGGLLLRFPHQAAWALLDDLEKQEAVGGCADDYTDDTVCPDEDNPCEEQECKPNVTMVDEEGVHIWWKCEALFGEYDAGGDMNNCEYARPNGSQGCDRKEEDTFCFVDQICYDEAETPGGGEGHESGDVCEPDNDGIMRCTTDEDVDRYFTEFIAVGDPCHIGG